MRSAILVFIMMALAFAIGFMLQTLQIEGIEKRLKDIETKLSIIQSIVDDGGL